MHGHSVPDVKCRLKCIRTFSAAAFFSKNNWKEKNRREQRALTTRVGRKWKSFPHRRSVTSLSNEADMEANAKLFCSFTNKSERETDFLKRVSANFNSHDKLLTPPFWQSVPWKLGLGYNREKKKFLVRCECKHEAITAKLFCRVSSFLPLDMRPVMTICDAV